MTHCDRSRQLFSVRLEGETSVSDAAVLENHLASCERCRREYEAFCSATDLVRALPRISASPDFESRVLARIREASGEDRGARSIPAEFQPEPHWWEGWIPRFAAAGAAAALAAIAILTFFTGSGPGALHGFAGRSRTSSIEQARVAGLTNLRQRFPDLPPELMTASQTLDGESYVMDRMVIRPGSADGGVCVVAPVQGKSDEPVYVTF